MLRQYNTACRFPFITSQFQLLSSLLIVFNHLGSPESEHACISPSIAYDGTQESLRKNNMTTDFKF